jgi:hypothetical protein
MPDAENLLCDFWGPCLGLISGRISPGNDLLAVIAQKEKQIGQSSKLAN